MIHQSTDLKNQCITIKNLLSSSILRPNTEAYLISSKWFRAWKESVGFDGTQTKGKVGPIDNNEILFESEVRQDAKIHIDFEVVHGDVYNRLHEWYGGGPTIRRSVERDTVHDVDDVIVRSPKFEVWYNGESELFDFSRNRPILELKKITCKYFKIGRIDKTRLCEYTYRIREFPLDDQHPLNYYGFFESGILLLEKMDENDQWPENPESKPSEFWSSLNRSDPGVHAIQMFTNGCYLSTVLQCLAHTVSLIPYFSGTDWVNDLNRLNPRGTKGRLGEAFCNFFKEMWVDSIPDISPRFFRSIISEFAPVFKGDRQNDVHELLTYTLDLVHEDLNKSHDNNYGLSIERMASNESELSQSAWNSFKKANNSVIVDNFYGLFKSSVECMKCHQKSITFEPFSTISCALPYPLQKTAPFTFIPWDLKAPRTKMQLKLSNPTLLSEVTDGICSKMKRNMEIIFAEHQQNSIELKWITSLEPSSRDFRIMAFELPPHDSDSLFAQARLMAPVICANRRTQKPIDPFFLVELKASNIDADSVQEACEKRFEPLFSPSKGEVKNKKLLDIIRNLYPPTPPYDEWQKLKAKIFARAFEKNISFTRDKNVPIATKRRIDVRLNAAIIRDFSKFEWTAMLNIVNAIDTPIETMSSTTFTLKECFDLFVSEDHLTETSTHICPFCHSGSPIIKQQDIWYAPKVLIIHLKRFQYNLYNHKKLESKVLYPEIFDLSPYISGPKPNGKVLYKLYAIIEHFGSLESGHYDAIIYHHLREKWYKYNEQSVQVIKKGKIHSSDTYVLFYSRIDD